MLCFQTELAFTMEVNEKGDVYSFGVLTLEILMGKNPGDLISLITTRWSSSASHDHDQVALADTLDRRTSHPANDEVAGEVASLTKMSVACINGSS